MHSYASQFSMLYAYENAFLQILMKYKRSAYSTRLQAGGKHTIIQYTLSLHYFGTHDSCCIMGVEKQNRSIRVIKRTLKAYDKPRNSKLAASIVRVAN